VGTLASLFAESVSASTLLQYPKTLSVEKNEEKETEPADLEREFHNF
jgi:hypothetical protein